MADLFGNTGTGTTDSGNYTIDTKAPTVLVTLSDSQLGVGETAKVTFTFSEAVTGFTTADLLVDNGVVAGLSTTDNIVYTGTYTPDADVESTTNVITVDNSGVLDSAGNAGSGSTDSSIFQIDTHRPTATVTLDKSTIKAGSTATLTATFSEAVSGLTNGDFTVANGSLSALSSADGGITWTGTFTPTQILKMPPTW